MFLRADDMSPGVARAVVRDLGGRAGLSVQDLDAATLLTSELVANAVIHTGDSSILTVSIRSDRLRVTLADRSSRPPRARGTAELAETGRGLLLVAALATRWGYTPAGGRRSGKTVWFELDLGGS